MERDTIIFFMVSALLYFVCFLFSRKNVLHEMIALWVYTIGFPLTLLYQYFEDTIERSVAEGIAFIIWVAFFSVIAIGLSFIEMKIILKRNASRQKLIAWQPVTITALFLISLFGGLFMIKLGYVLLALSVIGSLFIYGFYGQSKKE